MTTIVLAAGLSMRFGSNKLLLPYKNQTIIEETIQKVLPLSDRTIVVVGHDKEKIVPILSKYELDIVENKAYKDGQRTSTIKGIECVDNDDFSILPADLPLLDQSDILGVFKLIERYPVARAFYKGTPGHPVAYRKENRERLLAFPGSMKEYLNGFELGCFEASIGSVFDIDTQDKYEALLVKN